VTEPGTSQETRDSSGLYILARIGAGPWLVVLHNLLGVICSLPNLVSMMPVRQHVPASKNGAPAQKYRRQRDTLLRLIWLGVPNHAPL
jgi:hypothetical protein